MSNLVKRYVVYGILTMIVALILFGIVAIVTACVCLSIIPPRFLRLAITLAITFFILISFSCICFYCAGTETIDN